MSELYDRLLLTGEYRDVSMKAYIEGLVGHILEVYSGSGSIAVETRVEDIPMNPKKAASPGIILNELVTSRLKYAFPGRVSGSIAISLGGGRRQRDHERGEVHAMTHGARWKR